MQADAQRYPTFRERADRETDVRMADNLLLVADIAEAVAAAGGRALDVGGDVRGLVMERIRGVREPIKDIDVEVYRLPLEAMVRILQRYGSVKLVGESFGIATIVNPATGMSFDFSPWSFDWLLRSVSALRSPAIPGYTTTTIRGGWRINANLDLALVGQDLFDDHHLEWLSGSGPGIEVRRSVYARLTWRR